MDQGFKDEVIIHGALLDISVEVVRRSPAAPGKGFVPQPTRWVVEQTNGTLMLRSAATSARRCPAWPRLCGGRLPADPPGESAAVGSRRS